MKPDPNAAPGERAPEGARTAAPRCDDIQELLFDYMSHELGGARSDLVREHLRRCPACQAAAADIQATLDALRRASPGADIPDRLSTDRRARITWALAHPVLDWMYRHHVVVSVATALLLLAAILAWLYRVHLWEDRVEATPVVIIGEPPAHPPVIIRRQR